MDNYDRNPYFLREVETAMKRAVLDLQFETRDEVESYISPTAVKKHVPLKMFPPEKTSNEIRGRISYGKGLGPIFDKGTVQRRLKGRGKYRAGTNRGAITTASRAMERGREWAIRRGLDLRRYL